MRNCLVATLAPCTHSHTYDACDPFVITSRFYNITASSPDRTATRAHTHTHPPTEREWHGMAATANLGRSAKPVAAAMRARDGTTHTVTRTTR